MYRYDSAKTDVLNEIRSPQVYELNLAKNMALLSDDASTVRHFFSVQIHRFLKDKFLATHRDMFLGHYEEGQAYVYFGIVPVIVRSLVHLLTSNGFNINSTSKELESALNKVKKEADLQSLFEQGVYYEKGLGDFAYRINYEPRVSPNPIITTIEPQRLEVYYERGKIAGFCISEPAEEKPEIELCEIHIKNESGQYLLLYMFRESGKFIPVDELSRIESCLLLFPHLSGKQLQGQILPFKDWLVIFKKNDNPSRLYKGERGVPSIQGLDTIEDALCESASDFIDAIRKGGVKEFISDELIPQDENGKTTRYNSFNKRIVTTRGSASPDKNKALFEVVHGDIRWEVYTQAQQQLISIACIKSTVSPTTIGQTGLESINSSAEAQDTREKPSLRHRQIALKTWGEQTLPTLLNRYLQVKDYIDGEEILDYSDLINISFDDWNNPTEESLTQMLISQVTAGLKSRRDAVMDLHQGISEEEAEEMVNEILKEQQAQLQPKNMGIAPETNANSGYDTLSNADSENVTLTNDNSVNSTLKKANLSLKGDLKNERKN